MEGAGATGSGRPERRHTRAGRLLMIAGASLVGLGVLALAGVSVYVSYTNSFTRNQQKELERQWAAKPVPVTTLLDAKIAAGAPIARILVPRLKLDAIVVELSDIGDRVDLNRGPGHVPGTAYPGMPGNVFIAGHRTTYGHPFGDLDKMRNGDTIILITSEGRHVYSVTEQRIVDPHDLSVLDQQGEPRVTLMACHPKFTAHQRILVIGRLTAERKR